MRNKNCIAIIIIVALLTSCTSSQYVAIPQNETSKPSVQIYFSDQLPEKNYKVIGHIETSGWIFTSNKSLMKGLLKKVEKKGADAVIQVEFSKIPHILVAIPSVSAIAIQYED